MSLYNWKDVPSEIKYITTDSDGWKFYHSEKPSIDLDHGGWFAEELHVYEGYIDCFEPQYNEYKGDWQLSYEERPNEED